MHRTNASGLVQRRTEKTIAAANSKSKSDDESGDNEER